MLDKVAPARKSAMPRWGIAIAMTFRSFMTAKPWTPRSDEAGARAAARGILSCMDMRAPIPDKK